MTLNNFFFKVKIKLKNLISYYLFQYPRVLKYKFLSNSQNIVGKPIYNQPMLLSGRGLIVFGKNINLGVRSSPYFYSGYGYVDARKSFSKISIGDNVWINNNISIVSESEGITIGNDTLIGLNVSISDTDGHDLHPDKRLMGTQNTQSIKIGNNVFIGNNVKILKGVIIGDNSVIANSSVVTKSIPANVIAGGNPAKVIKEIDFN